MEDNHFVCSAKECNLRFSSEDTLQLHRKRHEMVLSLNKSNQPISDQTPTPVRFIRQCEEIGLFQDLQNVNPFEETFRKAAEAVKKGTIPKQSNVSILSRAASDDLHTPHIFPNEINIGSNLEGAIDKPDEEVVVRTEADTSLKANSIAQHLTPPVSNDRVSTTVSALEPVIRVDPVVNDESTTRVIAAPIFSTTLLSDNTFAESVDPVQVLLRMPNGSLVQLATKPITSTIETVAPTNLQLEETVKVLPRSCTNGGTVILATQSQQRPPEPSPSHQLSTTDVKQKLKQLLVGTSKTPKMTNFTQKIAPMASKSDNIPAKKITKNDGEENKTESEKEKRTIILERNRRAASRCRERRKRWVQDLLKQADSMAVTNKTLNDEIRSLKAEVATLRTLLLAHANCPVTLAQTSSQESICISSERNEVMNKRPRRDGLTLDIEQATRAAAVPTSIDLDTPTPTIVRSDKVLSSVAPPATPEQDRLVTFSDLLPHERSNEINEEIVEERHLTSSTSIVGGTTTVIQINPNAIRTTHHGFS